ncbi:MAG TPA: hypothetical protein VFZ73_06455, partial [Gemmatimonadaceae bacterium]
MLSPLRRSLLFIAAFAASANAQQFTTPDPVVRAIWNEGMDRSHLPQLAQALLDSIGPRLTGT